MPAAPGTLAMLAAFLGLFLGGAGLGGALAAVFTPGSWIAAVAGFFALPLAFAGGLQAWYGLALESRPPTARQNATISARASHDGARPRRRHP
jgi:hypothetical protein